MTASSRGQAAAELAAILPVLLFFILAFLQLCCIAGNWFLAKYANFMYLRCALAVYDTKESSEKNAKQAFDTLCVMNNAVNLGGAGGMILAAQTREPALFRRTDPKSKACLLCAETEHLVPLKVPLANRFFSVIMPGGAGRNLTGGYYMKIRISSCIVEAQS